ncbi:armadillo-like helical domain-containing protein 3 [Glandiceps talaboti]
MTDAQKTVLLRQGSANKMPLKEKIVQIYEVFFTGEDPSRNNANFWEEFFLLKANVQYIETELERLTPDKLLELKDNINLLFYHCTLTLKEDYPIRVVNALQTLCALIRGVYRKSLSDHGFDIINILVGFDVAESQMQALIENVNQLIVGDAAVSLKNLSFKLLLILVTVTDNVSQNTILEYIMLNSVFESIVQILANPVARQNHGYDAMLLLTILVNYRKYESVNPYIVKLSILDDELALTGLGYVISSTFKDFNRQYETKNEPGSGGLFSALTSMVGSMFVTEDAATQPVRASDAILLAMYEAVHLNRNFITVLTHNHTESTTSPPESPTSRTPLAVDAAAQDVLPIDMSLESTSQPTNILVTFLRYCSIILQDVKDQEKLGNGKLCMIILTCIAEDQYANSFLHDANMTFRVELYRAPMRHRKQRVDKNLPARPLACALLDLMVEFIMSHMMKNIPMDLYIRSLGIIHRILCYQKKCRVRLQYTWKQLWTALVSLLKYLLSNESSLLPKYNIFHLSNKVVTLFNLFITYGDTFLPSPSSYDELYYEIIRMHQVFDNLYSMALRQSTNGGEHKDSAAQLTSNLVNIRAIVNHFTPKIDSWTAVNSLSSLTSDQVLDVVRSNYDTLTLKLQDNLDQYERYSEKPGETAFFTQLVRSIISDVRHSISLSNLEQQTVLQEFSNLS